MHQYPWVWPPVLAVPVRMPCEEAEWGLQWAGGTEGFRGPVSVAGKSRGARALCTVCWSMLCGSVVKLGGFVVLF